MKIKLLILLIIATCLNYNSSAQKNYQSGIGVYPISFYSYGKSIHYNYSLSKNMHSFYLGLSTHLNQDIDKWSNTQSSFHNNGAATKLIHYFHPNIGYTRFFQLKKGFPISLFLNLDLQGGKINFNDKFYFGDNRNLNATFMSEEGYRYLQFTINTGLKINLNANFNLIGKMGIGVSALYEKHETKSLKEFPGTYALGVTYLFNNKK